MTAPQATDPAAFLDRLEETHNAATPGRWCDLDPRPDGISNIDAQTSADGYRVYTRIGEAVRSADAAAIVAAHDSLPALIAAVRGVLAKCDALEAAAPIGRFFAEEFRGVITAALGATGGEL